MSSIDTAVRPGSGAMFDRIAARYDLLNRVISLGLDRRWRRALIEAVRPPAGRLLDLATGTGDVLLAALEQLPGVELVGTDPSAQMLDQARRKLSRRDPGGRVRVELGMAEALPFADASFDAITMAFGIRNVADRPRALAEIARVARPGARVGILELGEPRTGPLARLARLHIHTVVPAIGAWLASDAEYRYLARSIAAFPAPEVFANSLREAGLVEVEVRPLSFGAVHLYTGIKPRAA